MVSDSSASGPDQQECLLSAYAGRRERGDVFVTCCLPHEADTLQVNIRSTVLGLYGKAIEAVVREVCAQDGFRRGSIEVEDDQALDLVIRARVRCALHRLQG